MTSSLLEACLKTRALDCCSTAPRISSPRQGEGGPKGRVRDNVAESLYPYPLIPLPRTSPRRGEETSGTARSTSHALLQARLFPIQSAVDRRAPATPDIDGEEQEQPDDVNEVPVPGSGLEAEMLLWRKAAGNGAEQADQ